MDPPEKGNMREYLNDGRAGNVRDLLRFRLGTALTGYLGLSYERKFSRRLGVEIGGYYKPLNFIVWNEYMRVAIGGNSLGFDLQKTKNGIGVILHPKYYVTGGKYINNGYYFGLRNSFYTYNSTVEPDRGGIQNNISSTSISSLIMVGSHQHMGRHFAFGVEWGGGICHDTYRGINFGEYDFISSSLSLTKRDVSISSFVVSIDMVFGYLF